MKLSRRQSLIIWLLLVGSVGLLLFGFARLLREEDNYSRIEDRLYLGGAVATPPRGTRAVLNLCETEDPYRCEFQRWEPIADSEPAPNLDWLRRMVELLDDWQRKGIPTYVHCRNGVSRSSLVVVAYQMHKNHWSRAEALEFVRAKRPIVRPNPAFMQLLLEWERIVKDEVLTQPGRAATPEDLKLPRQTDSGPAPR
jgi:hypothetical protein